MISKYSLTLASDNGVVVVSYKIALVDTEAEWTECFETENYSSIIFRSDLQRSMEGRGADELIKKLAVGL